MRNAECGSRNVKSEIILRSAFRIPISSIVPVAMMDVRIVRVGGGQFLVVMAVGMWLAGGVGCLWDVLVVLLSREEVGVRHLLPKPPVGRSPADIYAIST